MAPVRTLSLAVSFTLAFSGMLLAQDAKPPVHPAAEQEAGAKKVEKIDEHRERAMKELDADYQKELDALKKDADLQKKPEMLAEKEKALKLKYDERREKLAKRFDEKQAKAAAMKTGAEPATKVEGDAHAKAGIVKADAERDEALKVAKMELAKESQAEAGADPMKQAEKVRAAQAKYEARVAEIEAKYKARLAELDGSAPKQGEKAEKTEKTEQPKPAQKPAEKPAAEKPKDGGHG